MFAVNEITERQEKLIDQYFFQCTCVACMKDWPTYGKLQSDLNMVKLKCDACSRESNPSANKECLECPKELDNMLLDQLGAQQLLKQMLKFNLSTDIDDEPVRHKLEEIYETFCGYLRKLEFKKVFRIDFFSKIFFVILLILYYLNENRFRDLSRTTIAIKRASNSASIL